MKILLPHINFTIERWRYNKKYQVYVSTQGRVQDINHKFKKPLTNKRGYLAVEVMGGIKLLHRLVLETWKPKKDMELLTIDHINHNKRENTLKNLEWVTKEENIKRAVSDIAREEAILDNEPIQKSTIEVKNGQIIGVNLYSPIIKCGNFLFYTYEEAIQFLVSKKKVLPDCNKDTIRKGIINSIAQKKKYCNYTFELK